jgi:hypothetical protein
MCLLLRNEATPLCGGECTLDNSSSSVLGLLVIGGPGHFATWAYRQPHQDLPLYRLVQLLESVPLSQSTMWCKHDGPLVV